MPHHHNEQVEQSNQEKISNLIHTVSKGTVFKSFRDLCNYFGIEPKGVNSKKAVLAELSRYYTWENKGNKYIITEVFDYPHPKIDEKFLTSKFYPPCGYLLLVYLAEKYIQFPDNDHCYLTKRGIMGIISICNEYYSDTYTSSESIEDISNEDSESEYFIEKVSTYLYKETQRILDSLKSRRFLTFDETYMVVMYGSKEREATDEETKKINNYYDVILTEYNINNKNGIRFSKYKKEIYSKIDKYLEFKHYTAIKFSLTADLASNAEHLRSVAKLTEQCGVEVNSFVCSEIYNLVYDPIIEIRDKETKEAEELAIQNAIPLKQRLEQLIQEFEEIGAPISPLKFNKKWKFDSDDDIVKNRIENLITLFIRVNKQECEHTEYS